MKRRGIRRPLVPGDREPGRTRKRSAFFIMFLDGPCDLNVPGVPPPLSLEEAGRLYGWDELDVVLVTPDAFVDHPSFACALLARVLLAAGFRTGVLSQPDWNDESAFRRLGRPRLFFGVSGGNVDSMLMHYTAARKLRNDDPYSPGGAPGMRPQRPCIVYSVVLRKVWPDVPIVIGGLEASLRRFAHYDYWENRVRKPILVDCPADCAVYGMGERQIVSLARKAASGRRLAEITDVPGTVFKFKGDPALLPGRWRTVELPSFEQVRCSRDAFARASAMLERFETAMWWRGFRLLQRAQNWWVVENPPAAPLSTRELDAVHSLPFTRRPHGDVHVPALETVRFSLVSHRGCFGGCSFCALSLHQGRAVSWRSEASLTAETAALSRLDEWRGRISDVGGPSADMYGMRCTRGAWEGKAACTRASCLHPSICPHLDSSHRRYLGLLAAVHSLEGVKSVFVGSGCRYDLLLRDREALSTIVARHVGGQLKVAPEHAVEKVTALMRKPSPTCYERFRAAFFEETSACGRELYLVPYLMSSHPGCTPDDAVELMEILTTRWRYWPEQVQDFIPTPMTLSTAMYHLGFHPVSGESLYVARTAREKAMQRAALQPRNPKNRSLVLRLLETSGRGRALLADGGARKMWPWLFSRRGGRHGGGGRRRR